MKTAIKKLCAFLATTLSLRAKQGSAQPALEHLRFEIAKLSCQPGDAIVIRSERMLSAAQAAQIRALVEPAKPEGVTVLVLSGLTLDVLTKG